MKPKILKLKKSDTAGIRTQDPSIETRVVITLTENKKCAKYAKYDSSRPIVPDRTFLYADNGSTSEYTCLCNTKQ